MLRLETNLGWSDVHVKKGTPSHGQLIVSNPEDEALQQGRDALVASKATIHLMNIFCHKHHLSPADCSKHMTSYSLLNTPLKESCKNIHKPCSQEDILSQYRTIDGSCNHKFDGSQGSAFTAYKRLLHPEYLDGIQAPRRSISKKKLPSPRKISSSVVKRINDDDHTDWTLALPEWSRFIEYDLSHTATSKMVHSDNTIECCAPSGNHLSPRYIHPFCAPISVPFDDQAYSQQGMDCMTYVRSVPAFRSDCTFGPLEQVNQATHFLDGSQIYGSTTRKSAVLRSYENGQLATTTKHQKSYLKLSNRPDDDCQLGEDDDICFMSGDSRVNVIPQATAMYTIWLREHNRIAKELSELNPSWDDETLYQEARKIVIAEMQHITYDEWLPQILGKKYFTKIQKYDFDDKVDPSVSNSFATASIRALNSLMDGELKLYKENRLVNASLQLRNHFNNPNIIEQPQYLDALIRGLATQSSQKLDLRFAEDISSHLFSNGVYGYDVFSLDIQRGRDHGLPSYASYRILCGLPDLKTFDDLRDVMSTDVIKSLSEVYSSPRDIDLIVGGISERPTAESLFGPTLTCIFADQFLRTRRGDRYFYTNERQPAPFSRAQLREIQKVTLARIFCDNGDEIQQMQRNVFKKISDSNVLLSCLGDDIPRLNLRMWRDGIGKYY